MRPTKQLRAMVFLGITCLTGFVSSAPGWPQAASSQDDQSRSASPSHKTSAIDDRVKRLAQALDLTDGQQAHVRTILEQRQHEMLRLRYDSRLTGSQRVDQFRALQEETVARIRSVLTDEKKKKYDPLAYRKLEQENQEQAKEWLKPKASTQK